MRVKATVLIVAVAAAIAFGVAHTRFGVSANLPAANSPTVAYASTLAAERFADVEHSMSVVSAYRAIPHQRTPFNPAAAGMDAADARYLEILFTITDLAVVERVQTQLWLRSGGQQGAMDQNYQKILAHLDSVESPRHLTRVHTLIRAAIDEQRRYLRAWRGSGESAYFSRTAPLIRSSSGKLIAAYNILMALYPQEGARNRQAFFDHLCALDFI